MSTRSKLAVILHADVVGSTALVRQDERLAHTRIQEAFQHFSRLIADYGGVTHEIRGDALVAEFARASDAVAASLAFQGTHTDPPIRIGIALGEVIIADRTITGAGVVLAQRLEQLAEPSGVVVQGGISEAIPRRLPFEYENLGERELKGFEEPIRAFAVKLSAGSTAPEPEEGAAPGDGAADAAAGPTPTQVSIAVLPFDNLSNDPDQEYFADGISEDMLTELSRFSALRVISRNSSFRYKGQSLQIQEVGRELGARYVVEGSVRKAGNRIRITAQLIDAATGAHLWAERYDRELEDIFAVQDEVVSAIVGTIPGRLTRAAVTRALEKSASSLTAYDCLLRGRWTMLHSSSDLGTALKWFDRAVEADPDYALAHSFCAYAYSYGIYNLGLSPDEAVQRAKAHANRAVSLNVSDATIYGNVAWAYMMSGEHQLARLHSKQAIELNPNDADVLYTRAAVLAYLGEHAEALAHFDRVARIDPFAPDDIRLEVLADCLYMAGEYEKLIETYERWHGLPFHLYPILAAACAQLGRDEEAKTAVAEYERLRLPEHDIHTFVEAHMRICAREEDRQRWLEGYRKAGFEV